MSHRRAKRKGKKTQLRAQLLTTEMTFIYFIRSSLMDGVFLVIMEMKAVVLHVQKQS